MTSTAMRCGRRAFAVFAVLLAAAGWAQEPADTEIPEATVRVDLEPTQITVGDPVRVRLLVEWPAGAPDIDPRFPAWQPTWGTAEILSREDVVRERGSDGRTIFRQDLTVTAFEIGEVDLPAMTIAIPFADETREAKTPDDLRFEVTSVLPEGEEKPSAREMAALERLPLGAPFWWTTAVLSVLVVLLALLVARHHPEAFGGLLAAPRLPPFDELRKRLGGIDPSASSERIHTGLSLALRTYLGRATGLMAVERTTSEIQRAVRRGDGDLGPDLGRRVITLLQRCDEAKFVPGFDVTRDEIAARIRETEAIATAVHERTLPDDDESEGEVSGGHGTLADRPAPGGLA